MELSDWVTWKIIVWCLAIIVCTSWAPTSSQRPGTVGRRGSWRYACVCLCECTWGQTRCFFSLYIFEMWCSEVGGFMSCTSPHICVCLGVSVCCRCVTFSVPYSNTFSEAQKQLSVPFMVYRKTCQHLVSGAHRSQERMLYLELVHERAAFKGGCVIGRLVFGGKGWISLCKVCGCLR